MKMRTKCCLESSVQAQRMIFIPAIVTTIAAPLCACMCVRACVCVCECMHVCACVCVHACHMSIITNLHISKFELVIMSREVEGKYECEWI